MNGKYSDIEDTIAAISTAAGPGGIGIVRLSGREALSVADKVFISRRGISPSECRTHTIHYGWVANRCAPAGSKDPDAQADIIDEVLLTVMRAPKTYTAEDVVEINCHGGQIAVKAVLEQVLRHGVRLAEPGEFTRRAFLNGRLDLTQAEAVLDIIQAKTGAFLKVSTHQLKGDLACRLECFREILLKTYAEIEALVNFPDEEIESQQQQRQASAVSPRQKISELLDDVAGQIGELVASAQQGRILKEGIRVVICGRPNVGKSSLMNVLLRQPRAIVTEIAGTTRDTIEENLQLNGVSFQIIDTAGILEPRDKIEAEAVRRSQLHLRQADLLLFLLDASDDVTEQDRVIAEQARDDQVIIVVNKCDLVTEPDISKFSGLIGQRPVICLSALRQTGIKELEDAIVANALHGRQIDPQGLLISNLRHMEALGDCLSEVGLARERAGQGVSLEFISEHVKAAVQALDRITGRYVDQDVLDEIFAGFCIGK